LGPPTKSINNSGLGAIKRILCGLPPFLGGERYLLFGTELHYRCLERKKGKWKPYDDDEKKAMEGGVKAVMKNKLFLQSYRGAIIEKKIKLPNAFGIFGMHGTLDVNNKRMKRVLDLKTTSCFTEDEFIEKAIKLGYPRQGVIYEELSGNKESIFLGISKKNIGTEKKPEYPIFIFDLNNFPQEKEEAKQEAEFLLSFYKEFGLPVDKYIDRTKLEWSEKSYKHEEGK
jgi:hypothetical protein